MINDSGWLHLRDIEGSLSNHLSGRTVAVALSGSIAVLEVHRLVRLLIRHGATVQCFLTASAAHLVSPTSLEWCTGYAPILEISGRCEHLEFFGVAGRADLLLMAPTTANTLAKVALGLDDNAVTTAATTALGQGIPVLMAPGMHEPMLANPAVRRNLEMVAEMGVELLQPTVTEGKAKMMGAEEICARVMRRLGPGDLKAKRIVLTGGPTREFLDPARCLTNPSSGLSACLLAGEAYRRGADVHLVYGPGRVSPAPWLSLTRVDSGAQMSAAVQESLRTPTDLLVAVAAVCDFQPEAISEQKISTERGPLQLSLRSTPKIIRQAKAAFPDTRIVAFKAAASQDDDELAALAEPYLEHIAEAVIANSINTVGQGFDSERNRYLVCTKTGRQSLGPAPKSELAWQLWDWLVNNLLTTSSHSV